MLGGECFTDMCVLDVVNPPFFFVFEGLVCADELMDPYLSARFMVYRYDGKKRAHQLKRSRSISLGWVLIWMSEDS